MGAFAKCGSLRIHSSQDKKILRTPLLTTGSLCSARDSSFKRLHTDSECLLDIVLGQTKRTATGYYCTLTQRSKSNAKTSINIEPKQPGMASSNSTPLLSPMSSPSVFSDATGESHSNRSSVSSISFEYPEKLDLSDDINSLFTSTSLPKLSTRVCI